MLLDNPQPFASRNIVYMPARKACVGALSPCFKRDGVGRLAFLKD